MFLRRRHRCAPGAEIDTAEMAETVPLSCSYRRRALTRYLARCGDPTATLISPSPRWSATCPLCRQCSELSDALELTSACATAPAIRKMPPPVQSDAMKEARVWHSNRPLTGHMSRGIYPPAFSTGSTCLPLLGLLATGIAILNDDALGFSAEGKVLLKSVHVSFGYVMALNLLWRFVWAFFGNRYSRWRSILPGGPGFIAASRAYAESFLSGEPQQYVGHNPLARIGVALLFVLLLI